MNYRDQHYWFPAKRIGWGWGIANCWQGALIQVAYPILSFMLFRYGGPALGIGITVAIFAAMTVAFIAIHWFKGEPPYWRW